MLGFQKDISWLRCWCWHDLLSFWPLTPRVPEPGTLQFQLNIYSIASSVFLWSSFTPPPSPPFPTPLFTHHPPLIPSTIASPLLSSLFFAPLLIPSSFPLFTSRRGVTSPLLTSSPPLCSSPLRSKSVILVYKSRLNSHQPAGQCEIHHFTETPQSWCYLKWLCSCSEWQETAIWRILFT